MSPSVDSDSDSSDSDSESVRDVSLPSASKPAFDEDEDEEPSGPPITSAAQVRTKNEVPDLSVVVPDITEVGPEELLEKVGEVMSVLDNMVIVKGLASKIADQAAESVLDSDSLLVFDDRKVLGYVSDDLVVYLPDTDVIVGLRNLWAYTPTTLPDKIHVVLSS